MVCATNVLMRAIQRQCVAMPTMNVYFRVHTPQVHTQYIYRMRGFSHAFNVICTVHTFTYILAELLLAIEEGYRVLEIFEIWNWPKARRSKTLFREFIGKGYKGKFEAAGKCHNCF